jgi:hypothetical protein
MLQPGQMTGRELDDTATAVSHLLGLDGRAGDLGGLRGHLRALQEVVTAEQIERRAIATSKEPIGPSRD